MALGEQEGEAMTTRDSLERKYLAPEEQELLKEIRREERRWSEVARVHDIHVGKKR